MVRIKPQPLRPLVPFVSVLAAAARPHSDSGQWMMAAPMHEPVGRCVSVVTVAGFPAATHDGGATDPLAPMLLADRRRETIKVDYHGVTHRRHRHSSAWPIMARSMSSSAVTD